MADFTSDIQGFRPPSFPFFDNIIDPNLVPINHFSEMNQNGMILDNSSLNNNNSFLPFSGDNFFSHHHQHQAAGIASELLFPGGTANLAENFPAIFHQHSNNNQSHHHAMPVSSSHHQNPYHLSPTTPGTDDQSEFLEGKKRKAVMMDVSETSSLNLSPQGSENGKGSKNNSRRGKRAKGKEEDEKPKEVVHVRARRGQATDSHSLAERVRRGKINERLKCLQDIVPGCYKTMGMAVMLDEIINYVQSLQNQVEFLSMKLTAASTFYDFNSEADALETMQRAKVQEAKEMERVMKEGYGEGFTNFHPTWSL